VGLLGGQVERNLDLLAGRVKDDLSLAGAVSEHEYPGPAGAAVDLDAPGIAPLTGLRGGSVRILAVELEALPFE
jgi:hypothetical protein